MEDTEVIDSPTIEAEAEELYQDARLYATGELTKYAVQMLEYYSDQMGKAAALGMVIESLSESLGNMISLVSENSQTSVIESANQVIHQGILSQSELVAEMAYGQVGHC